MKTKTNPKKIPRSEADVIRARQEGFDEGIKGALAIMMYTPLDKFSATDEEIREFNEAFRYTLDSLNKGYIKDKDIQSVLKAEYGWEVEAK